MLYFRLLPLCCVVSLLFIAGRTEPAPQLSPVSFLGGFDKLSESDRQAFSKRFEKEIWPLMTRHGKDGCVGCHDKKNISTLHFQNDADKDFRKMLKDGFFLPNDQGSILFLVSTKTKSRMPPGNRPRWTAKEIETLRRFVVDLDKKQQR